MLLPFDCNPFLSSSPLLHVVLSRGCTRGENKILWRLWRASMVLWISRLWQYPPTRGITIRRYAYSVQVPPHCGSLSSTLLTSYSPSLIFFCSLNITCTLPPQAFGTKQLPLTGMPSASLPAFQGTFHFAKPNSSAKCSRRPYIPTALCSSIIESVRLGRFIIVICVNFFLAL